MLLRCKMIFTQRQTFSKTFTSFYRNMILQKVGLHSHKGIILIVLVENNEKVKKKKKKNANKLNKPLFLMPIQNR